MTFRDTAEDMQIKDKDTGDVLTVKETLDEHSGSDCILFTVDSYYHGGRAEIALNQEQVRNLMEKMNIWLRHCNKR